MNKLVNKFMSGFSEGTCWSRKGQCISGTYLGIAIIGEVLESRIKYGGKVQHSIVIAENITLPWNNEMKKTGEVLLITEDDVEGVFK